jgi:hypothetical protein
MTFSDLIKNFFTHKDFLPSADKIPGTLFTPLHLVFALILVAVVVVGAIFVARLNEKKIRIVLGIIWAVVAIFEVVKIIWESTTGKTPGFNLPYILPLYPCSIFMYAMPLVIWGKGELRRAGCGYVCTLGFVGGLINFVYPVNILARYSCISFAGMHTFFYHGAIVFAAIVVLASGYHSFGGVKKWWQLLTPSIPFAAVSIVANIVNFSKINSDYMFFKLDSFIFKPIGAALPVGACVAVMYVAYILIHAAPYIPSFIKNNLPKK